MTEQRVSLPTRDGLQLEGRFSRGEKARGSIILCHPHPLYGGDMDNNVIAALQATLAQKGFSTLRFNFRGVGKSEGGYGEGVTEVEDVQAAVAFAAGADAGPLYLAGYSFGAYAGAKGVAQDDRVKAICCISPPVAIYDFALLREEQRPKLIVTGKRDLICPANLVEELFLSLSEPKVLQIVAGADHFWWGIEDQTADYCIDFLQGL
ncbi:MAG: alpha/beta fold hydrolase [Deltaproteobacteria bacterium]|nr:alpha/beta fold hydrolase [Deltaproteobacteria bacterium]